MALLDELDDRFGAEREYGEYGEHGRGGRRYAIPEKQIRKMQKLYAKYNYSPTKTLETAKKLGYT